MLLISLDGILFLWIHKTVFRFSFVYLKIKHNFEPFNTRYSNEI